jgi:cell division FtsZ-interacting protein ZapD
MSLNQNLFNTLSDLGLTPLTSEMHSVIEAVRLDNEEVKQEVNGELIECLSELVRVYEHGDFQSEFKPALDKARQVLQKYETK